MLYRDASPRRLADPAAATAFRSGWNRGTNRCVPVPPGRRAPVRAPAASECRAILAMVGEGGQIPLPAGGSFSRDGPHVAHDTSAGIASDALLAASPMASGSNEYGVKCGGAARHGGGGMDGSS